MMEVVYWMLGLSFTLVSVVFAVRLAFQSWLDYVQIKEGIDIMRMHMDNVEEGFDDDNIAN
jgi:hypothetical protein